MKRTSWTTSAGLLYRPEFEHDSCGTGFVADKSGKRTHRTLQQGLTAVVSLTHRGAVDADAKTGDGAGVMTQIPYGVLKPALKKAGVRLEDESELGVGMVFLSRRSRRERDASREIIDTAISKQHLSNWGWRKVPVDKSVLGDKAALNEPVIEQVLIGRPPGMDGDEYERRLYLARRQTEYFAQLRGFDDLYIASMSHRTVVYKGMFVGQQLGRYYKDLHNPKYESAIVVYHQRYSTNTFPSWELAQPFRFVAHNGEINTLKGNVNWVSARERGLDSEVWNGRLGELGSTVDDSGSDSSQFDNTLDFYVQSGRTLPHALMLMVPEAFEHVPLMNEDIRAFYRFHECISEPWDGPSALTFSDGRIVGAALDRNGLRPARYKVTKDGLVVMASEVGVLGLDDADVVEKGRLGPGQMLVVDTETGEIKRDSVVKHEVAGRAEYRTWVEDGLVAFNHEDTVHNEPRRGDELKHCMLGFGYSKESVETVLQPMIETGKEPLGSMGDDTPIAVLSTRRRSLYSYFKQLFAQVTNPPIDHLREELVMSLTTYLGSRRSVIDETPDHVKLVALKSPFLTPCELDQIRENPPDYLVPVTLPARFKVSEGAQGLETALRSLAQSVAEVVRTGHNVVILSHADVDAEWAPIPMLLAVGAVHHHLIRQGRRMQTSLIAETDDAYEVHHCASLIGYGAEAVVPRLAFDVAIDSVDAGRVMNTDHTQAIHQYRHALEGGLLKMMSKMGISTVSSYRGAKIFEALGLHRDVVAECFTNTPSRIGGVTYNRIASDTLTVHAKGFPTDEAVDLVEEGTYRYRKGLEYHAHNPQVFKSLHKAVREGGDDHFKSYIETVESRPPTNIRDLLDLVPLGSAVPLDEVEPAKEIAKRFVSAAMSYGALSKESHELLAIAMNRIGGKSNSGEGGEDPDRFTRDENGDLRSSMIKQIASGRFGVTPEYLASAKQLEIKMAQGSKPGEGGQLPGTKVSEDIARVRHSVAGVTLISPPPHHDIYSIEDLAQLIYDLKHVNSRARISVKLVSEAGIGTVSAGVAKAYADVIHISGADGGTGASPLSSIKHAGLPWELGLAEAQQTLMMNGLRSRVLLRVDGGFQTGRDVVIGAMLGAEEYGFGTAALVASGCVMARQCHLNTCPVGVATQREDLRKRFPGKPEHVVAFMMGVAEHVRELLASLGARSLTDIIGRMDMLRVGDIPTGNDWEHLDFREILAIPDPTWHAPRYRTRDRNNRAELDSLDDTMLQDARDAIRGREGPVTFEYPIRNVHRAVGTKVAGAIAYEHGDAGLADGTIEFGFSGTAGQSFGAFCINGLRLSLVGEANDYVGKGMHGGEIVIRPPEGAGFVAADNVLIGNTCMYGATGGVMYIAGRAGERFAVRNSGGTAVIEGVGDHGCEYMTGGSVIVLGPTGRNFAAGMTGGTAYVYDRDNSFPDMYNPQLVDISRVSDINDVSELRTAVERHFEQTDSVMASSILDTWDDKVTKFWKVVPHEAERPEIPPRQPGERVRHLPVVEHIEGEVVTQETDGPVNLVTRN
jgi:glutamate synthase domain-containing protein 2/glutamate synthase domain-containing protein 1/glutamate synthase domain-containing protein 3